ncbi:MAG: hypothetical protein Q8L64_06265 [bacterium]|nr:hypothetical protein [bacterium]
MEKGFLKAALVIIVAGIVAFIVLAKMAQYVPALGGEGGGIRIPDSGQGSLDQYSGHTNPLLDFTKNISTGSGSNVPNTDGKGRSPYAGSVTLSTGNASSAIQPFEEHVIIQNRGTGPVSITGWKLENGKGSRPIETSQNTYVYPSAESAIIGVGTEFLSPDGRFTTGNIVLQKGDRAIVTTGGPFTGYSLSINTSFRENICLGYLDTYPFTPRASLSCPLIMSDPLVRTMTDQCYSYLRTVSRCQDPTKTDTKRFDEIGSQCKTFIRERVGYAQCVANNKSLSGFATNQWRVFLGKPREMWAQSRETITLYDAQGLIVAQINY